MEMKADPSHVLMSDVLKDKLPDLAEQVENARKKHVIVVGHMVIGTKTEGITGILRGVLFGAAPEIEFRIQLESALTIIQTSNVSFAKFELHHEERIVDMPGPFTIVAARIDEILAQEQMCTLGLHLKRAAR